MLSKVQWPHLQIHSTSFTTTCLLGRKSDTQITQYFLGFSLYFLWGLLFFPLSTTFPHFPVWNIIILSCFMVCFVYFYVNVYFSSVPFPFFWCQCTHFSLLSSFALQFFIYFCNTLFFCVSLPVTAVFLWSHDFSGLLPSTHAFALVFRR